MGYIQLIQLTPTYILSDSVLALNDLVVQLRAYTWALIKSIKRIEEVYPIVDLRCRWHQNMAGGGTTITQLRLNGVPISGISYSGGGSYVEDIHLTTFKAGDMIEVWGYNVTAGADVIVDTFDLFGTETNFYAVV